MPFCDGCDTCDKLSDIQTANSIRERIPNEFSVPLCTFGHHFMHIVIVIIQYYYSDKNKHADQQYQIKTACLPM